MCIRDSSFGALLRQLPGKTEVPNLLVDISQTGLAAGLEEQLFQPAPEVKKDFYAELPIKIRLSGGYHQLAQFVSGIAALPRIVTLGDIEIKPASKDSYDQLVLDPVSYTHLDVYKRQMPWCVKKRSSSAARKACLTISGISS